MDILKKILRAILGYAGSSENPQAMSMRLSAIIIAVIGKLVMVASVAGYVLPLADAQIQLIVGNFALVGASIAWLFGLVRYVVNSVKLV